MTQEKKQDIPIVLPLSIANKIRYLHPELSTQEATKVVILQAAFDVSVVQSLAKYFKKAFLLNGHAWLGEWKVESYKSELVYGFNGVERVHVRLSSEEWETLSQWWNCLDCPKAHALGLLAVKGVETQTKEGVNNG